MKIIFIYFNEENCYKIFLENYLNYLPLKNFIFNYCLNFSGDLEFLKVYFVINSVLIGQDLSFCFHIYFRFDCVIIINKYHHLIKID